MSRVASAAADNARREAVERPARRFAVLDRQSLAARSATRQARALGVLAGVVVAGALGLIAATQSLVASQQVRLDGARQQLATAVANEQQLQATRARLASPARVLQIAEADLRMVSPAQVIYLAPVPTGPTLGSMSAPSATISPGTLRLAAPAHPHNPVSSR